MIDFQKILIFWYQEHGIQDWFSNNPDFDEKIANLFFDIHSQAGSGELYAWRKNSKGRLAEIIVLDQFTRNLIRARPSAFDNAFIYDGMALILAQEAIAMGADKDLNLNERQFLYMPYMHSESRLIQKKSLVLFADFPSMVMDFAIQHHDIIQEFGRFPHRNQALQRKSSATELKFLETHTGF